MCPERTVRIDLGCGARTLPGFIGVDRFPLPGVQVLADLDRLPLPFPDNCADLILGFHSLEHVADLLGVMREIWRIGKPGSQVCIVAPYYNMSLNLANPYHKQAFNEHTPRFWTHAPASGVDPREWQEPPLGSAWGLSRSDNSDPGLDLRCMRMEFFYFSEYWGLPAERVRRARRKYLNVCEQIMYHLAVFKPPLAEADLNRARIDYFMPPQLDARRQAAARARSRWFRWLPRL
jgi:SAM-dependent methyltransferase